MGKSMLMIRKIRSEEDYDSVDTLVFANKGYTKNALDYVIKQSEWLKTHKLRKNGVHVVLIECRYFDSAETDIKLWANDCFAWVQQHFVMSALSIIGQKYVCDGEDCGSAYVVLVPLLPTGKISYEYFFASKFQQLQNDYTILMKHKYGLGKFANSSIKLFSTTKIFVGGSIQPTLSQPTSTMDIVSYAKIADAEYKNLLVHYLSLKEDFNAYKADHIQTDESKVIIEYAHKYINFVERNGSIDNCEKLIMMARKLQFGVRRLQEMDNKEGVDYIHNVLKAGELYMAHAEKTAGLSPSPAKTDQLSPT